MKEGEETGEDEIVIVCFGGAGKLVTQ